MTTVGIFGASGMAREVGDIVQDLGSEVVYIARDEAERDHWTLPGAVIAESELDGRGIDTFAIGIGDNGIRERIATRYRDTLRFATLIHPSATFGNRQREAIERRTGIIVCAGVRFTNNISVGDFAIINLNATIAHDVVIEDFVTVAAGASIAGNVHLGTRVTIGTGAAINQGTPEAKLVVGSDTVVGSGAVVVADCEPDAVYVGIPARRIR